MQYFLNDLALFYIPHLIPIACISEREFNNLTTFTIKKKLRKNLSKPILTKSACRVKRQTHRPTASGPLPHTGVSKYIDRSFNQKEQKGMRAMSRSQGVKNGLMNHEVSSNRQMGQLICHQENPL